MKKFIADRPVYHCPALGQAGLPGFPQLADDQPDARNDQHGFCGWTCSSRQVALSYPAGGLLPNTPYYSPSVRLTRWTPCGRPTCRASPGGGPSFSFDTVFGFKYRMAYKNSLADAAWQPVLAPPSFAPPDGWSATANGAPMSLSDTNTDGQAQRYYRLETATP